jgi:ribosomal protection tetracycline resistance protein
MESLNLGVLAHVDAGKTSLTERLLYDAGVIDHLGSVDRGDTHTDTLSIERQRGITVRSAVASFEIGAVSVNLIDTPGHPDFIAEVERVLRVLDGAVMVLSAVEGVQPQTRVLMRALRRLGIPTLLFVNKIDREGARDESLLREICLVLRLTIVPMGSTSGLGTRAAEFAPWTGDDARYRSNLAEALGVHDERILIRYIEDEGRLDCAELHDELKAQLQEGLVHPVFFGSARTGAGIRSLMSGISDLLPSTERGDPDRDTLGTVFEIERGEAREKIAYVRLFSGTVHLRDRLVYGPGHEDTVTRLTTAGRRTRTTSGPVVAGDIAKIWGLRHVQIGDRVGQGGVDEVNQQFAPPTTESVVQACNPADEARLRTALSELTEQDPLIKVRQDHERNDVLVSLYGEVQKEVVQSRLRDDYGIEVDFRETTTIFIERPKGTGEAVELLTSDANPFMATVGLRIQPGPVESGVRLTLDVDERSVPLFIFKTVDGFIDHMTKYIRRGLRQGLFGWEVTDCEVTLVDSDYYASDGPTKPNVPMARATSADFRDLTPRLVRRALECAGTRVCAPMACVNIECPSTTISNLVQAITRHQGVVEEIEVRGDLSTIGAKMPVDRLHDLQRGLPGLTGGEGSLESQFVGYEPVRGRPPTRGSASRRTSR